jgi:D-tyrosyl-tRNA(Tyr) deacylase
LRAVIQRVQWARVTVEGELRGEIGPGLAILLGIAKGDDEGRAEKLARKIVDLRVFADAGLRPGSGRDDKMNRSLADVGGEALVISQFTLFADVRKGRRPYFGEAEAPERAELLCNHFAEAVRSGGVPVQTGVFGAMMQVELCNDGPVTLVIDSNDLEGPRRAAAAP